MVRRLAVLALACAAACGRPNPGDGETPDAQPLPAVVVDSGVDGGEPDAGPLQPDAGNPHIEDAGFIPAPVYAPNGPLCDIPAGWVPDSGAAATYIDCDVAADRFTDRDPNTAPAMLTVVEWNVEFGKDWATVRSELLTRAELKNADVLLLSEVPRDSLTSNPQNLDLARELARERKLDYAFAVEWDRRNKPAELGEHGVAILSKYPLGNVAQIRHVPMNDWYKEDQLYGGRITLAADALIRGKRMRFYSSHLCTRGGQAGRAKEAAEIRAEGNRPDAPAAMLVAGDLNTWECNPNIANCTVPPSAEATVKEFLSASWKDGTEGWNGYSHIGAGFFPQRLDWIFYRGTIATPGKAVGAAKGSDHLPVVTQVAPP